MLSINISELIWTIINFFLLYFLLKRFLYDPIIRFTDARKQRLDDALGREKAAQAELEACGEGIERKKAQYRGEADRLIREAGEADSARSAETLAAARREADSALSDAAEQIRADRERDAAALEAETQELAEMLAREILNGEKGA